MRNPREQLLMLLRLVLDTEPEEIDCDQFLQRVGVLLEPIPQGQEPEQELAAVSQHLTVCPECREELDALVRALEV